MKKVIWALLLIALGVAAALYFTKDNQPQEETCCECCAECDSAATCENCDSTAMCEKCDSAVVAE